MRISLELVPRIENEFLNEVETVNKQFKSIDLINLPDILRNDIRSWDACYMSREIISNRIPHIRACDFSIDETQRLLDNVDRASVKEVLIVSGDQIPGVDKIGMTALEMIAVLKANRPGLKVFGALDPYRKSLIDEVNYCREKLDVGADGFFTQPLFDLRLLEIYKEQLADVEVFWGLCPVVGERSHTYWTKRNNVLFPKGFVPELSWNKDFSCEVLQYLRQNGGHVYFMPIKVPVVDYLTGVVD